LVIAAHPRKIGQLPGVEGKLVLCLPACRLVSIPVSPLIALVSQAVDAHRLRLLARLIQPQRFAETFAKTDIGQPAFLKLHQQG
jgi:hypothetical protein